jgi:hypothetical protein
MRVSKQERERGEIEGGIKLLQRFLGQRYKTHSDENERASGESSSSFR